MYENSLILWSVMKEFELIDRCTKICLKTNLLDGFRNKLSISIIRYARIRPFTTMEIIILTMKTF